MRGIFQKSFLFFALVISNQGLASISNASLCEIEMVALLSKYRVVIDSNVATAYFNGPYAASQPLGRLEFRIVDSQMEVPSLKLSRSLDPNERTQVSIELRLAALKDQPHSKRVHEFLVTDPKTFLRFLNTKRNLFHSDAINTFYLNTISNDRAAVDLRNLLVTLDPSERDRLTVEFLKQTVEYITYASVGYSQVLEAKISVDMKGGNLGIDYVLAHSLKNLATSLMN